MGVHRVIALSPAEQKAGLANAADLARWTATGGSVVGSKTSQAFVGPDGACNGLYVSLAFMWTFLPIWRAPVSNSLLGCQAPFTLARRRESMYCNGD